MHIQSHKDWFISSCTPLWKVHDAPGPLGGTFILTEKSSISGSGTEVSWREVLQLTSKIFWKTIMFKILK